MPTNCEDFVLISQCFDNDGNLIASAGNSTIIYDPEDGKEIQVLSGLGQIIDSAYDKQSGLFVTQSDDGTIQIWHKQ